MHSNQSSAHKATSQLNFAFTNHQINSRNDPTDQRIHALEVNFLQLKDWLNDIKSIPLKQNQQQNQDSVQDQTKGSVQSHQSQADGTVEFGSCRTNNREQVDIHPTEMTYLGRELTTSSCLLMVWDEVYWNYSGALIKQVKIVQVENAKTPTQASHLSCKAVKWEDTGRPSQRLFVIKDEATQLSPIGTIAARHSILTTMSSQLDLAWIGNLKDDWKHSILNLEGCNLKTR